ncbi:MAG: hypothetical protein HY719_16560, partial [Planctomycetes bacterium]|nr:hypothetical protein [Planctomycetota bacterium]
MPRTPPGPVSRLASQAVVVLALFLVPIVAGCGKNDGASPGAITSAAGDGGGDSSLAALRIERLITANEGGDLAAPKDHPLAGAAVRLPRFALAEDAVITMSSAAGFQPGFVRGARRTGAGSVSDGSAVRALTAASFVAPRLPAGVAAVGPVIDLGPSGTSFTAPVEVTLPYSEGALKSLGLSGDARVAAFTIRSDTGQIDFLPIVSRDTQGDTVTVRADHFSLFGTTTEPNVGVLWRLVSTITSITLFNDAGEPVAATYPDLTNFGDEDIDLAPGPAIQGDLIADDLNGNNNPFSLRGSAVPGGAVAFAITGFGAAPAVVGGTVNGATSPARTDYAGSHAFTLTEDHGDQIVGSFAGGYDEVTYVDDEGVTRVGRVAYSGAFTVDVIRADDLEAADTVMNVVSPTRGAAALFVTGATEI